MAECSAERDEEMVADMEIISSAVEGDETRAAEPSLSVPFSVRA